MPYDMPGDLRKAIEKFVEYYNYRRYHEGISNVTPYDIYTGRHTEVLQRRKEARSKTSQMRKVYNKIAREQDNGL